MGIHDAVFRSNRRRKYEQFNYNIIIALIFISIFIFLSNFIFKFMYSFLVSILVT